MVILQQTIGFFDPSPHPQNPGWPLRNLLAYLRAVHPSKTDTVRVLCWRDTEPPGEGGCWRSRFGILSGGQRDGRPSIVGWEKNVQGKLGPRVADLAPMMDPTRWARWIMRNL